MSVLANNNRKVCLRLAMRTIRANRTRSVFLCLSVMLVSLLYMAVFYTADAVYHSYLLQDQLEYGSASHIVFDWLTEHQADRISRHDKVKSTVELHSIGILSDELLEYRTIRMAAADQDYAESVSAVPQEGHMPEKEGEIALDTMTLDSLGIPHRTGTAVRLDWGDNEGNRQTEEFILCGWWDSESVHTESCAWITPAHADKLRDRSGEEESITLGVMLYHPEDLEAQAEEIVKSLGLGDVTYTTNLAYNSARIDTADQRASGYLFTAIFVVAGGFLLIYNIMAVSLEERVSLLSSMKAMGMTPFQAGLFSSLYALLLCIPSVPSGMAAGFVIFYRISGDIVEGLTGIALEQGLVTAFPFLAASLFSVLTAWAGCFFPTCRMNGWMPAKIREFLNREYKGRKKRKRGDLTAWGMAWRMMAVGRRSLIASVCSFLAAALVLGGSYIRYISYDSEYYARETYVSDYSFLDASCAGDYQRYNERAGNLTEETAETIRSCPEVAEYGEFLTHEVDLTADDALRGTVVDFYNETDGYYGNVTRKESMSGQPGWIAGLEKLEATGQYRSVLIGADGLVMDYVLFYEPLDGTFDAEKFASGKYVLSVGAASAEGISSAPAGSSVVIGGRTFTVMAAVEDWGLVPAGRNSRASEFSLNYVLPSHALRELYPGLNIRQIMVNVKDGEARQFEQRISALDRHKGIVTERKTDRIREFQQSAASSVAVEMFTGILLLFISILGFLNVMMTKILSRRKEFALYQSLGMEKRQIRKVVFFEGVIHGAICAAVLPFAGAALWYGMASYYDSPFAYISNNDWAVIYQYSPLPLFITACIIFMVSVTVPQLCLRHTERESVVERMRYRE